MKELKIGIIGTCRRGSLADRHLTPDDHVRIVAGADVSEYQLDKFKNRIKDTQGYLPNAYLDYREMIEKEELDGVFICSPDFCHEEQAIFALEHKVPVYLEKPIAITIEGADRILRAAYENKSKLMLGHNMRYQTFVLKMKELIDSGAIGEVKAIWCRHFISYGGDAYFYDWHADRRCTNSLLLQKGAHDIDVIHWLAGSYTKRVCGFGALSVYGDLPKRQKNPEIPVETTFDVNHWPPLAQKGFNPVVDVEDISMITMQLENGVQASYQQCHFTPDSTRNFTVIGTKGRIENYGDEQDNCTVELWDYRKIDAFRLHGDATFRTHAAADGHGGSDPRIVRSFYAALRGEGTPNSTPQAARYSVAAGCLGTESIRSGGIPKEMPKLPPELENYAYHK